MNTILGYDGGMKRLNQASLKALLVFLAAACLSVPMWGQVNGPPASVTSTGFGGHPGSIHGVAPSVTSLGPQGYTPGRSQFPQNNGLFGVNSNQNINGSGHHHHDGYLYPGYYGYYGGYYDSGSDQSSPPSDDQYNGGPTIFDRRGSGGASYVPMPPDPPSQQAQSDPAPEPATASDQPSTVLIFKDGHQTEVANYAIVGNTLYDLTDGRRKKIALDDLDLTATAKENEGRGTDFELPGRGQAN
jgi:hypothetical protein